MGISYLPLAQYGGAVDHGSWAVFGLALGRHLLDAPSFRDAVLRRVGLKAHEKHHFRIGDQVTGLVVPVPDPREEWATHHKVSKLKLHNRGPEEQGAAVNPGGRIAPPVPEHRAEGHRRLDKRTDPSANPEGTYQVIVDAAG